MCSKTRAIHKDGKIIILQGRCSCVIDDRGRPIGLYAFQDVSEELEHVNSLQKSLTDKIEELENIIQSEREARESLYLSQERYRVIVEQSADIMFDWDLANDVVEFSNKHTNVFGEIPICRHPLENNSLRKRIHPKDEVNFLNWMHKIHQKNGNHTIEFRCIDAHNEYIWVRCCSSLICDMQGKPLRAVGMIANINKQKNELVALTLKSQRDPLTKKLHKEELSSQIQAYLNSYPDVPGAFFMIDIDNFKVLNDNLGHQLGDSVLLEFSNKLTDTLPESSIIGRMGGDEFGAYIPSVNKEDACKYANILLETLHKESSGENEDYNVRVSIGISLYPNLAKSFEELYFRSDIALYESKHGGKDCYTVFKEGMRSCSLVQNRTPIE